MTADRLELSREEMRTIGHQVVDSLVDYFDSQRNRRVTARADRKTLETKLNAPFPEQGRTMDSILEQLQRDVFSHMMHVDHPRFFAFVPGPGNFVGAMADALAAGLNVFQGTWLASSGPSTIELLTVDWLRQICGLPEEAGGLFLSGGSMANLTALAAARHVKLGNEVHRAVIYYSDQTHSSLHRALRVLGFTAPQLREIPSDEAFRLPVHDLEIQIAADRANGLRPFCVIANAGTTNTGAVDPLPELADLCAAEDLWLHADGAFGAASCVSEEGRAALAGLERVDSLSIDPHKWLFQPFECGCVLMRNREHLEETFRILPDYLQDVHRLHEINYCDSGVQLTRSFRALKLWMSLQFFGIQAFRIAVGRGFELARLAEKMLREMPGWQMVTPAQLCVVSFRYAPAGMTESEADQVNQALVGKLYDDGFAFLSSTVLRGRTVLRLCAINPRTTEQDIADTIRLMDRLASQ